VSYEPDEDVTVSNCLTAHIDWRVSTRSEVLHPDAAAIIESPNRLKSGISHRLKSGGN
jgi:hypothetical protein